MSTGLKVVNTDDVGVGVSASGGVGVDGQGDAFGVVGSANSGPGVFGTSKYIGVSGLGPTGVSGVGTKDIGVQGQGGTTGVLGAGLTGVSGKGEDTGVAGSGKTGVYGTGGVGVSGYGQTLGAVGVSSGGTGVLGWSGGNDAIGVHAVCPLPGWAVVADGRALIRKDLFVDGALYVFGFKGAVVKTQDGSHRALYCVESPDSWFEDFGRARLVRGRARVSLDRTFAGVVRTGNYHVFVSPEGLCAGLYVSRRVRNGFEVRELQQGKSTVTFSYRIVARRKDVDAPRFGRVKLPDVPKTARPPKVNVKFPDLARAARRRQSATALKRSGDSRSIQRRSGRRRSRAR